MATWTTITDAALEPGKPGRSIDALALRDNVIAIAEGAAGAPKVLTAAINDLSVTTAKIAAGAVTEAKLATGINPWILIDSDSIASGASAALEGMTSAYSEYEFVCWNMSRLGSASVLYIKARVGGVDVGSQITLLEPLPASPVAPIVIRWTMFDPDLATQKYYNGKAGGTTAVEGVRFYTTGNGPFTGQFRLYGR